MDLELLKSPLELKENPGLQTTDARLSDVATLVQEGDYLEAANQSREILQEKIYDIRIIGYFLYGHYAECGLPALGEILFCLESLIGNDLEAIGPERNRAKQFKNTLGWLVKILANNLDYEEGQRSATYSDWQSTLSADRVDAMMDAIDRLVVTTEMALEDGAGVSDGLIKLKKWLSSFRDTLAVEAVPEQYEAEPGIPEESEMAEESVAVAPMQTRQTAREDAEAESIKGLEGSFHMKQLIIKLDAFNRLITSGKLVSAAVVADDINSIIANFDPRLYLPGLFVKYAMQTASNINSLVAYSQYRQSPAWTALQELYKVDIESFVEFDSDSLDFSGEMPCSGPDHGERHEEEY